MYVNKRERVELTVVYSNSRYSTKEKTKREKTERGTWDIPFFPFLSERNFNNAEILLAKWVGISIIPLRSANLRVADDLLSIGWFLYGGGNAWQWLVCKA